MAHRTTHPPAPSHAVRPGMLPIPVLCTLLLVSTTSRAFETEPNDIKADATEVETGAGGKGHLHLLNDPDDWLFFQAGRDGTVHVRLSATTGDLDPDLYLQDDLGNPLGESSGDATIESVDLVVTASQYVYFHLVAAGGVGDWYLSLLFEGDPPVITSDDCGGSCQGASVTLTGSGFGTDLDEVYVLVSGVMAEVTSVSDTQLVFWVPYGVVDGAVVVQAGGLLGAPYPMPIGDPSSPPSPEYSQPDPTSYRITASGEKVSIDTLDISFCPGVDQAAAEVVLQDVVTNLGYVSCSTVGRAPYDNTWQVEFDGPQTIGDLLDLLDELTTHAEVDGFQVDSAVPACGMRWDSDPMADGQTGAGDAASRYAAFQKAGIVGAWDLFRVARPEHPDDFGPVVYLLDTGFRRTDNRGSGPDLDNFPTSHFKAYIMSPVGLGWIPLQTQNCERAEHGTMVASVAGAYNLQGTDEDGMNGVLAGFQSDLEDDDADGATDPAGPEALRYRVRSYRTSGYLSETHPPLTLRAINNILRNSHDADMPSRFVVNLSSASDFQDFIVNNYVDHDLIRQRIEQTRDRFLYVVSAGNDGGFFADYWPGCYAADHPNVVAVAASVSASDWGDTDDEAASFPTARGSAPEVIIAPGDHVPVIDIFDDPGDPAPEPYYGMDSGTSFAAPLVSASASMLFFLEPAMTPQSVVDLLVSSGDNVTALWGTPGSIRLDLENALRLQAEWHGSLTFPHGHVDAYTANESGDDVSAIRLDPASQAIYDDGGPEVWTEYLYPDCLSPVDVVVSPNGYRVYVLCQDSDSLAILDAATLEILRFEPLPAGYTSGQGKRLEISDEEVVAIPMEDGSELYVALYEGRTDSWIDADDATGDIDPFQLGFVYDQSVDITALPLVDSSSYDTFWMQGYSSALEPGGLLEIDVDTLRREVTAGSEVDLTTTALVDAATPSGLDYYGDTLYMTFSHTSSSCEQAFYPFASGENGSNCGSFGGYYLETPKDITIESATGAYGYIGHYTNGMFTLCEVNTTYPYMPCLASYWMGFDYDTHVRTAMTDDSGTAVATFQDWNTLAVVAHDTSATDLIELLGDETVNVGSSDPLGVAVRPSIAVVSPMPNARLGGINRFQIALVDDHIDSVLVTAKDGNGATVRTAYYDRLEFANRYINDFFLDVSTVTSPVTIELDVDYDTSLSYTKTYLFRTEYP